MWIDRTDDEALKGAGQCDGGVQTRMQRSLREPGKQIVVYGETGVGKTSLVEHACRSLDSDWVAVQCSTDLEAVLKEALATAGITEERFEEIERTSGRAGVKATLGFLFSGWQREDVDTRRRLSYPVSIETTARVSLDAAGIRILFLDSFENADPGDPKSSELRAGISRLLKTFASEGKVKVVVAGIPRHAEPLLDLDPAAARRAVEIVVPRMTDDALAGVIRAGADLLGLPFEDECVRAIVRVSQGLPSLTHEFALNAASAARIQEATSVRLEHLEGVIPTERPMVRLGSGGSVPRPPIVRDTGDADLAPVDARPVAGHLELSGLRPSGWVIREILDQRFLSRQLYAVHERLRRSGQPIALPPNFYQGTYMKSEGWTLPRETLYMPRDPFTSLLQSVLTFALSSRASELLGPPPADQADIAHAVVTVPDILTDFGPCSAHWIDQKLAECMSMLEDRRRLPPPAIPADPVELAPDARLILVSDWATALPSALAVAREMRRAIHEARRDRREVHVVHLGDVYYSGWSEEYEDRFLPYWPADGTDEGVGSWALAGNHDLYSAGHGYFGRLLRDARFKRQQGSSWFSLANSDWQVLGLDTSYLNETLTDPQLAWLTQHLDARRRRTMLLSHHPPVHTGSSILFELSSALSRSPVDAWFWGHDHRCELHAQFGVFEFGACIGHGGVPELYRSTPSGRGQGTYARWWPSSPQTVAWTMPKTHKVRQLERPLRGFAVVDFDGSRAEVEYRSELGDIVMTQPI
jgi:hypothetical protein